MSKIPELMGGRRLEHGITVESGGITVQAGGLTAAGGQTIDDGGLTITAGGLTVTAGGIDVDAGGAAIAGGVTVEDTGLTVDAGGIEVTAGGIDVTAGGIAVAAGPILDQTGDGHNVETLAANKSLLAVDAKFQKLDPNGAHRTITLPAEETSKGMSFRITNSSAGAWNLVIENDAAGAIVTLNQNEATWVSCNGTNWIHMGVETIALA